MAGRKSWVDVGALIRPGKLTELFSTMLVEDDKTAVLPVQAPPQVSPDKTAVLPAQAPAVAPNQTAVLPGQAPSPQAAAPSAPAQSPFRAWPAIPKMGEVDGSEPSLASRTRPDLPSSADRQQNFVSSYLDPQATNNSLRKHNGSSNVVFHGQMSNGQGYVAKPHEGIGHRDRFHPDENKRMNDDTFQALKADAPGNAARHDATYSLMSAMGAHHMVTPGMQSNMHGRHQFKGPDPDEDDDEQKRLTMASHHAGGLAHVQEFVKDAQPLSAASPEQLDQVDAEHRLHGAVAHLLMGNGDGHGGNVMLHKSGHPVLIDHDITLGSSQARAYKEHFGKDSIRSVFAPGGPLDYQAKLPKDETGKVIPVGTNFPPRMKETLQRAAEGYFSPTGEGNLGLSDVDHAALQKNARELLSHGVEGTLARRHDIDAEARAKKAEKAARLAKEQS
jgi:hypothetical protein